MAITEHAEHVRQRVVRHVHDVTAAGSVKT
jgi:hypothetical protein